MQRGGMNGSGQKPGPKNFVNHRYKTVKCKNIEQQGFCKYGDKCLYAHGDVEIREGTEMMGQQPQNNFGQGPP